MFYDIRPSSYRAFQPVWRIQNESLSADPTGTFYIDADPDPTFCFDADLDPNFTYSS